MIEREHITDLMVAEVWAFPKLMKRLLRDRKMLGLRNVIVLESPMGGEFAVPALEVVRKTNATLFRELSGGLLMEDLLKEHEATPIVYGSDKSSDASVILHTTGTVNGMHKPIPMSDKALNAFIPCALKAKDTYDDFKDVPDHLVSCLTLNMSWVYSLVDMLHMPFVGRDQPPLWRSNRALWLQRAVYQHEYLGFLAQDHARDGPVRAEGRFHGWNLRVP